MNRIALVLNPSIIRDGIARIIESDMPDTLVHCYGYDEINQIHKHSDGLPNLLIIGAEEMKSISQLELQFINRDVKVILWFNERNTAEAKNLLRKNIYGYFYKEMTSYEFLLGIKSILKGHYYIHPELILEIDKIIKNDTPENVLTKREWDMVQYIVRGLTNQQIAEELELSSKTVNNHMISLFKKLNVNDRTDAVLYAVKHKWLKL